MSTDTHTLDQVNLEVFFIDVGAGDAILIQTPDDRRVLVDGGQTEDAYEFIRNKYRLDKRDHYVDFEAIIEYCSTFTELVPGDVLVTGTPGGVGAARNPPVFMDQGDVVEVEVKPIGLLRNRIVIG